MRSLVATLSLVALVACAETPSGEKVESEPAAPTLPAGPPPEMEMVLVHAGSFTMGSPAEEPGRLHGREAQHKVTLTRDFYMQKYEITQREWRQVMGVEPGSRFKDCGDECPIEATSWYEAIAYANALSKAAGLEPCYQTKGQSGRLGSGCDGWREDFWCLGDFRYEAVDFVGLDCKGYRLPTEAEWEYAARAGTTTITYAGDLPILGDCVGPEIGEIAWFCGNRPSKKGPQPIGGRRPNPWGLHDMMGNVYEWVWDSSSDLAAIDVVDPTSPAPDARQQERGNRGGDWSNRADEMRSAHRRGHPPERRGDDTGFRLVRTAKDGLAANEKLATAGPPKARASDDVVAPMIQVKTVEKEKSVPHAPGSNVVQWMPIPAGRFDFGSPADEPGHDPDEGPIADVVVAAFEMARTEVTVAQYRACVDAGVCESAQTGFRCNWGERGREEFPVNCVTEDGVAQFCQWVGGRLPTEAEWEYASRAGSSGARYGELDAIAWWRANADGKQQPVAGKQANAWGLHDMLGNVWELVLDFSNTGPADTIARGGAWVSPPPFVRAASRFLFASETRGVVGFRPMRRLHPEM